MLPRTGPWRRAHAALGGGYEGAGLRPAHDVHAGGRDGAAFYCKLGYRDAGGLLLDVSGYEQPMEPMELFLIKAI